MTASLLRINFRDLGGLRTTDGSTVRQGVVYRSEGPARFAHDQHAELRTLGFRTVCDLRSQGERESAPHTWCGPDCRVLPMEMTTDVRAQGRDAWAAMRAEPTAAHLSAAITASYRAMPGALLPHLRAITSALVEEETPLLVQCTAGKDRTGVAVALLLSLVDVVPEDIAADYGRSAPFMEDPSMRTSVESLLADGIGVAPSEEMVRLMLGIDDDYLATAFDEVTVRWGGVGEYFAAGGVDAVTQHRLRGALLDPPGSVPVAREAR